MTTLRSLAIKSTFRKKAALICAAAAVVRRIAQCRWRSNIRQYQALFYLLIKHKPASVSRALQLVLRSQSAPSACRTALRDRRHLLERAEGGGAPLAG